jgi:hypothetical protein
MKLRTLFFLLGIFAAFAGAVKANIDVDGDLIVVKSAAPGESYEGDIVIRNNGDETEEIKVYQTDYSFQHNGSNYYGEPGQLHRSNAFWISFSPKRATIPPGQKTKVHYVIKVPAADTLRGSYWSMLMIEGVNPINPEDLRKKNAVSIKTVMRYGIQLVTDIGTSGKRQLKFLEYQLLKDKDKTILQVDLENIGESWLRPQVWAEVYDENGNSLGNFPGGQMRTYPNTSLRFKIDLGSISNGMYRTLIVADCGGDDLFGMEKMICIAQ